MQYCEMDTYPDDTIKTAWQVKVEASFIVALLYPLLTITQTYCYNVTSSWKKAGHIVKDDNGEDMYDSDTERNTPNCMADHIGTLIRNLKGQKDNSAALEKLRGIIRTEFPDI